VLFANDEFFEMIYEVSVLLSVLN